MSQDRHADKLDEALRLLRIAHEQLCGMTQQLHAEDWAAFGAPSYLIEIERLIDAPVAQSAGVSSINLEMLMSIVRIDLTEPDRAMVECDRVRLEQVFKDLTAHSASGERRETLEAVLRGLRSEEQTTQVRAIIASVEAMLDAPDRKATDGS